MNAVDHPYLEGVKCREDGAVFVPATRNSKGHWTFGCRRYDGRLQVTVSRKFLLVHRLICEAFHGTCPPDKTEVDHIDRNPINNTPENLRWVDRSGNSRNRKVCEESIAKYGVAYADDSAAYQRARYAKKKAIGGSHGDT